MPVVAAQGGYGEQQRDKCSCSSTDYKCTIFTVYCSLSPFSTLKWQFRGATEKALPHILPTGRDLDRFFAHSSVVMEL
jgi:hypothetical protein